MRSRACGCPRAAVRASGRCRGGSPPSAGASNSSDAHGDIAHLLTYEKPHRDVAIVVSGIVATSAIVSAVFDEEGPRAPLAYLASTPPTRADECVRTFAAAGLGSDGARPSRIERLATDVSTAVKCRRGVTSVNDDAATVLGHDERVCQDHAHVRSACCSAAGIPARYVSGYFYTGDVATHAWADAWLGASDGWLSIDLTHNALAGERHCRLAVAVATSAQP